jgi:hypothetical protein
MKKIFSFSIISLITIAVANAQYKEPDPKYKDAIQPVFPTQAFDLSAAKNALAPGTATIKGVLHLGKIGIGPGEGFKKIYLFPGTPYFKEWYDLKKKGVKVKKGMIQVAAVDSIALQYKYWCETNVMGEFTFPNLKPGKYILFVTVDKVSERTFDRYTGSGYNNDGGQTDYYSREHYYNSFKSDLLKEVEIPKDEAIINVTWKK